jgi:hypothetical protein
MKTHIIYVILLISPTILSAANDIDSNNKYAWSTNSGWIDFGSVLVHPDHLEGYAWAENIGWLQLSGDTWKVSHDGQGNLSGYAWNILVG